MEAENMSSDFLNIAITPEEHVIDEAEKITFILTHSGINRVHLRHPGADEKAICRILESIPDSLYNRITIHSCHTLSSEYGVGIHHSSKDKVCDAFHKAVSISRSCHSIDEIKSYAPIYDYLFISPIFDSISKTGYRSNFTLDDNFKRAINQYRVVALGGITPHILSYLKHKGFAGAAMLGAIPWHEDMQTFKKFNVNQVSMVQFITDGTPEQCIKQAEEAIKGGVRWIQLRMKDAPEETVIATAKTILPLCRQTGTTFIINDNPSVALEVGADGVHLGKNDMPPRDARELLGADAIIGATANSLEDVKRILTEPIDYIGLGPLHFTGTKKNLSAVLGLDGVSAILDFMRQNRINIPVVVIGGITIQDIPDVINAGASGIAVSGAIAHAENIKQAARSFTNVILI